jgi:amidophosphoribosyltransferase
MCGIFAVFLSDKKTQAYPYILSGLTVLQHRGQDAAGIHTCGDKDDISYTYEHKAVGKIEKVFGDLSPDILPGNYGVGHVRYCTAGTLSIDSAQPLRINKISLVHNGNLTNTPVLIEFLQKYGKIPSPTASDSEVLLQVFDLILKNQMLNDRDEITNTAIFCTVNVLMKLCKGSFSVALSIRDFGLVVFRDPRGIRPLCIGKSKDGYAFASESVALQSVGVDFLGDVKAGECITVTKYGVRKEMMQIDSAPFTKNAGLIEEGVRGLIRSVSQEVETPLEFRRQNTPCLFEYIYFARPESVIDGILVYQARKNMGEALANKIMRDYPDIVSEIDVVMPVPDSARISALRASYILQKPYCEGLIKNAYVGRTFIMPSQTERKRFLKMKLNTIDQEFRDKVVLVIDDSIVRGNTSMQIIEIVRKTGAKRIIFASIAPPVRYPNVYGIAIPTESELIASGDRSDEEIARLIGADMVIFNDLEDVVESCNKCNECNGKINSDVRGFEVSCFSKT